MEYTTYQRVVRYLLRRIRSLQTFYALKFSSRPTVKVYGLLRTGTNYMNKLLETNFDVYCLNAVEAGWKHGPCKYNEKHRYVFMVKNPYSWMISFQKWEILHGRSNENILENFILDMVTHPQLREEWNVDNPISAWNETLRSWGGYSGRNNVVFVRYEDLLESYDEEMSKIRDTLSLKQIFPEFKKIESRVDNWKTPKPRSQLSPEYYKNGDFLDDYTSEELAIMRKSLDKNVLDLYRYKAV